jgi:DNA-binding NarL/FixJ family response regulator
MHVPPELRVLVIADDPLARAGLASLLGGNDSLVVTAQVAAQPDLLEALDLYKPDAVLWDLGWGGGAVGERLADVRDATTPVLALVADETQASEAWASGVAGILPRAARGPALVASLQAAAQGLAVVAPEYRALLARPRGSALQALPDPLTAREREVLGLIAEGLANKTISQRLGISEHTVKFHVNSVMGKLGAQSRTEAVSLAVRMGIVHL